LNRQPIRRWMPGLPPRRSVVAAGPIVSPAPGTKPAMIDGRNNRQQDLEKLALLDGMAETFGAHRVWIPPDRSR
jgi:hypothetical protein